jgi:hypothetical protein
MGAPCATGQMEFKRISDAFQMPTGSGRTGSGQGAWAYGQTQIKPDLMPICNPFALIFGFF